jgi:uncharacterized protein
MAGGFEIFTDTGGLFRFRLTTGAGAVVAVSDGFEDKTAIIRAITAVREHAAGALITDLTTPAQETQTRQTPPGQT